MDSDPNDSFEIIIVGAGPVGLSLALGLARENIRVLILEQEPQISDHSKAPGIWSKTLEVLEQLGVVDKFLAQGELLSRITPWDADRGEELFSLDLTEVADETKYPYLLILPQPETERLLLEELKKYQQVDIRFSSRFDRFRQWQDGVSAVYVQHGRYREVYANYLVGCDGAQSRVRELLGFELRGDTFDIKAALADIKIPGNPQLPYPRISHQEQFSLAIKLKPDLWRMILPFGAQENTDMDLRIRRGARNLFGVDDFELIWKSEFKLHDRISSGFVDRRVVLAGDAAHLNSPVGGQGMNSGIQDTIRLKASLMQAVREDRPAVLAHYAQERRAALKAGVNHFTALVTRIIFLGRGRFTKRIMRLALKAMKIKPLRYRFITRLTMQRQQLN
jgi:3-(3-hydroxy-phenyl)propionate hydroxylase